MSPSQADRVVTFLLRGSAGLAGILTLLILIFLVNETLPILNHIGFSRFFTDPAWHPVENMYNLMPMMWGTVFATAGAMLVATPLGMASALFCQFYAPKFIGYWYRKFIELLAGIPSVVYGLWGLVVLVPLIASFHPPGPSLLAGIAILALMILPTIALVADASFSAVPKEYIHGGVSLGLSRWSIIRRIIIPTAASNLFTGIILQTGRALGETMAILMVCGNVVQLPTSVFDPIRTLTANMALEMAYAVGDHRAALFFSGILLLGMVIIFVLAADRLGQGRTYAS